jgi:hypothetical protein
MGGRVIQPCETIESADRSAHYLSVITLSWWGEYKRSDSEFLTLITVYPVPAGYHCDRSAVSNENRRAAPFAYARAIEEA